MPHPLDWIDPELAALDRAGLRRRLRCVTARDGPWIELDGRRLANFGSNDYLGLAGDPRLAEAAAHVRAFGWGAGASPLITGRSLWHAQLEERIARFLGAEAALLFSSGYAANLALIPALVGPGDAVLCDRSNHASLVDACRLSGARRRVYDHSDLDRLERALRRARARSLVAGVRERPAARARRDAASDPDCDPPPSPPLPLAASPPPPLALPRLLLVTDTLFSMDGDLAPLSDLADLAERHGAMLAVDEAHATGVFGARGRGVAELMGVEDRVHVRMGTLSKALGCVGAFVAGSHRLIDWLVQRARPYLYSTAMPPANCAAVLAAMEIVEREPERRTVLLQRAGRLREQLAARSFNIGRSAGQIIPIILGDPACAVHVSQQLEARGLFVPAIRPPTVRRGTSRLRISLTAVHDDALIASLVDALAACN